MKKEGSFQFNTLPRSSKLKYKLGIEDEEGNPTGRRVKTGKVINWFGGKDLKSLIGFDNDIKYKQYVGEDAKDNVKTISDEWAKELLRGKYFDEVY